MIRRLPFQRLVREICEDQRPNIDGIGTPLRFRKEALEALQIAAEAYLTDLFADASLATVHGESRVFSDALCERRKLKTDPTLSLFIPLDPIPFFDKLPSHQAKRVTLMSSDIKLALRLRGDKHIPANFF